VDGSGLRCRRRHVWHGHMSSSPATHTRHYFFSCTTTSFRADALSRSLTGKPFPRPTAQCHLFYVVYPPPHPPLTSRCTAAVSFSRQLLPDRPPRQCLGSGRVRLGGQLVRALVFARWTFCHVVFGACDRVLLFFFLRRVPPLTAFMFYLSASSLRDTCAPFQRLMRVWPWPPRPLPHSRSFKKQKTRRWQQTVLSQRAGNPPD